MSDLEGNSFEALSKEARLEIFLKRLAAAPAASSFEEAYALLCETLKTVEDAFSGIPAAAMPTLEPDGRMYPPFDDNIGPVAGSEDVTVGLTRGHRVYFGGNGAIEIRTRQNKEVIFEKAGADGLGVWSA